MEASAWRGGSGDTYGIRVGMANREKWFDKAWTQISVEMDGKVHCFKLTPGFWNKCPEFRDSGAPIIRDWLKRHRTLNWPKGSPPTMTLVALGRGKFQLLP